MPAFTLRTRGGDRVTSGVFVVTDVPDGATPVQVTRAVTAHRDAVRQGVAVAIGDRPAPSPFAHHFGAADPVDALTADVARVDARLVTLRSGYMSPGGTGPRSRAVLAEWYAEHARLLAERVALRTRIRAVRRSERQASRQTSRASTRAHRARVAAGPVDALTAETAALRAIARAAAQDGNGPVDSWADVSRKPRRRAA